MHAIEHSSIVEFLLKGDVSVLYQTKRDLLQVSSEECKALQDRIEFEGFGKVLLSLQNIDFSWGCGFYAPKWISSHYTLLELKALGIRQDLQEARRTIIAILDSRVSVDGGVNPAISIEESDVCVNGMFLQYACYFKIEEKGLSSIIDYLIKQQLPDGGFNCMYNRSGATHSSMHSTISVLEGLLEYVNQGYTYKLNEISEMQRQAEEFLLIHRLYKSDRTGQIINEKFLTFSYPCRWYYDVLRGLEYFAFAQRPYDLRMEDALLLLLSKRSKEGFWKLGAYHPGQVHFKMEAAGQISRWNTLRAMRVLKTYHKD